MLNLPEMQRIAEWLREQCGDDEQAFADSLEGCTDTFEALEATHKSILSDEELIVGIKARKAELETRLSRIEARKDVKRKVIGKILRAVGLKKAELVEGTVSVRDGKPKLVVLDKDAVPEEYQRVTVAPDMTAIKTAFENVETLPNWIATQPATDVVMIRSK